jgi:putative ABC transport system permease protein
MRAAWSERLLMRAIRFALLALSRDWRSGELAVLLAALLVAVTALTGVGFFTDRIGQAVDQRAAEVLAADLRLRSPEPITAGYEALAAKQDIATARLVTFPSVVFFGADSALAAVRAAGPGYPLRGRIKVSDAPFSPARETDSLPGRGEAWLDSRLLARLGARVGDRVNVGVASFAVTRVLDYRPDQGSAFVDLAPSILLPLADLDATGLLGPGSRATYALLFAGKPATSARSGPSWRSARRRASGSWASRRKARRCNPPAGARGGS